MIELVQKRRFIIIAFLLAMTVCNLVMPIEKISSLRRGFQDFTIYYMAGLLVRNGHATDLYDLTTQYRTQLSFADVPIRQGPLPYNHPPFEAVLFVPFTLLSYWPAYILWTILNLIMLAASVVILRGQFSQIAAIPTVVLGLGATAFFPVVNGIFQGQDVILLLLLFVLAAVSLDRGEDAMAGAFLAAGLFLPHLIMPVVVLFAVRRWRVLVGFAPVTLFLGGISVAITGWRGPLDYVRFVLHVEKTGATSYGPQVAPNLRGLIADLPGLSALGRSSSLLIFAASLAIFFVALRRIRKGRDSALFISSLSAVTALLVSFHALSYDLALVFPAALFLLSQPGSVDRKTNAATILLAVLLFLTPLYIYLVVAAGRFFWFSLILLWIYLKLVLSPVRAEVPA